MVDKTAHKTHLSTTPSHKRVLHLPRGKNKLRWWQEKISEKGVDECLLLSLCSEKRVKNMNPFSVQNDEGNCLCTLFTFANIVITR